MATEVEVKLRDAGAHRARVVGAPESGWVIIDYLNVVVHLFTPVVRGYYALEQLWGDARLVRDDDADDGGDDA